MIVNRGELYRLTQQLIVEGGGQAATRKVDLVQHGPNWARNLNIIEELTGNVCTFSDSHVKARQILTNYHQHVSATSSRLQDHTFLNTLTAFEKEMAKNSLKTEYKLCLYTELDVKSNFLTANYPLADLEFLSNLYRSRLEAFQDDLQFLERITDSILSTSATLQDLASGCGEHVSPTPPGDAVCNFLGMYSDINTAIQRTYAPRMVWYGKIKEHVEEAEESLTKTLSMLQRVTGSPAGLVVSKVIIRDYVGPFVNAMRGLILTVREDA